MVQFSCQFCYTDLIIEQKYPTHNQKIKDMLYHTNNVCSWRIFLKRVHTAFKHTLHLPTAHRVIKLLTISLQTKLDATNASFVNLFLKRRSKEHFLAPNWNDGKHLDSTDNFSTRVHLTHIHVFLYLFACTIHLMTKIQSFPKGYCFITAVVVISPGSTSSFLSSEEKGRKHYPLFSPPSRTCMIPNLMYSQMKASGHRRENCWKETADNCEIFPQHHLSREV